MVSMVMVSMKPLCAICGDQSSGKHFDAYVCEGCKAFFRLRKLLNKIIEECLVLTKKNFIEIILLIIFSGGRSERVLVTSTSAKGTVSVR